MGNCAEKETVTMSKSGTSKANKQNDQRAMQQEGFYASDAERRHEHNTNDGFYRNDGGSRPQPPHQARQGLTMGKRAE